MAAQAAVRLPTGARAATNALWIVFTLTEGRSLQLFYTPDAGLLGDGGGTESYRVPQSWLTPVLGDAPLSGQNGLGGSQVAQEPGRGAPAWWVLMLGGGFFCLAAAVWLRRRWA